jgi:plasmid stability protein
MPQQVSKRTPARNAVQISLPKSFGDELRAHAELHGRSMAAQLEHWSRIAMAIETIGPGPALAAVKSVPLSDAAALREAFSRFLLGPSLESTPVQLAASNLPSFGMSPDKPGVIFRIESDGSQTEGHIDATGTFVPSQPAARSKNQHAQPKQGPTVVRKRSPL